MLLAYGYIRLCDRWWCVPLNNTIKLLYLKQIREFKNANAHNIGCDCKPSPPASSHRHFVEEMKQMAANNIILYMYSIKAPYCTPHGDDDDNGPAKDPPIHTHTHTKHRIKFKMRMPDAFVYFILFVVRGIRVSFEILAEYNFCSSFGAQKMNCFQVQWDSNRRI